MSRSVIVLRVVAGCVLKARVVVACVLIAACTIALHAQDDTSAGHPTTLPDSASWLDPNAQEIRAGADTSKMHALNLDSSRVTARIPSRESMERVANDDAFDYGREYRNPDSFFKRLQRAVLEWLSSLLGTRGAATVWDLITYVLVGAAVIWVLIKLITDKSGSLFFRGREEDARVDALEDDVRAIDYAEQLARALQANQFRHAVRLHFLRLLRDLNDAGAIAWRQNKTDQDYAAELSTSPLKNGFERAALLYEYVWYGDFPIDRASYERISAVIDRVGAATAAGTGPR